MDVRACDTQHVSVWLYIGNIVEQIWNLLDFLSNFVIVLAASVTGTRALPVEDV